jgi:hypothetical protein
MLRVNLTRGEVAGSRRGLAGREVSMSTGERRRRRDVYHLLDEVWDGVP